MIVEVQPQNQRTRDSIPIATKLLEKGNESNIDKRLLFYIVEDYPQPDKLFHGLDKHYVVSFISKILESVYFYPGITDWLNQYIAELDELKDIASLDDREKEIWRIADKVYR